jgi:beta-phosphoglucomutase-like phosphatase (HAD superfamily)
MLSAPVFAACPHPGVRELIQTLKSVGVLIGIATASQAEDLARYDEQMGILDLTDAHTRGDLPEGHEASVSDSRTQSLIANPRVLRR